jgi:uncharacterized membrane-anchored protein YjiN (DUF445 family)
MKRVLVLIILGVALVGCGDSKEEELSGALGGSGKEDSEQLEKFFREIKDVSDVDIRIVQAFSKGDIDGAKRPIDELRTIARNAQAIARGIDGEKLRTYLGQYSGGMATVADDYQAFIDAPADTTDAEFKRFQRELVKDKNHLAKLDGKLLVVLKDVMTPESYKRLQEHIKDVNQRYNDAAGG